MRYLMWETLMWQSLLIQWQYVMFVYKKVFTAQCWRFLDIFTIPVSSGGAWGGLEGAIGSLSEGRKARKLFFREFWHL